MLASSALKGSLKHGQVFHEWLHSMEQASQQNIWPTGAMCFVHTIK